MSKPGQSSIGVDVGGTFTDLVCVSDEGKLVATKVPSTPGGAHVGVLTGVERVLEQAGLRADAVARFIHGTTVATNAIIEQKGSTIGILMTAGFEDTLEIGRYKRSQNYDIWHEAETPVFLAPWRRRRGMAERIDHHGAVLVPLDEDGVRKAIVSLVEEQGVEAVAVCYLFSFRNAAHEQRTREIANELYPLLAISLSSEVNPEIREYERLCVTAFDAYIRPVVGRYLSELTDSLRRMDIRAPLQVMESRGGIADARLTIEHPSSTIMSGPAAGVMGALYAAAASGFRDIVSIDIGGTSSDVSLAVGGRPVMSREGRILTYPVRVPMIDVNSIGAGGGSIAWFDVAGSLHVGPRSAGADPGPACYARGGTEATVTDASVVLGYINPDYFAGGTFTLDPERAFVAVGQVASRLGLDVYEAARGIHRIVNASMTDQIRLISIGRGIDPRRLALVLLGGAGPLHGCQVAEDLGISTLVVPALPGVLSALGLLVSDVEYEQTRTFRVTLESLAKPDSPARSDLETAFARMDERGLAAMRAQGIPEAVRVERRLDIRYVGQSYELEVPIDADFARFSSLQAAEAFEHMHRDSYGHVRRNVTAEVINLRTVHVHELPKLTFGSTNGAGRSAEAARKGEREAYFSDRGLVPTPIYERSLLPVGARLDGPVILEQADTTVVVEPGWNLVVDEVTHLIVQRKD